MGIASGHNEKKAGGRGSCDGQTFLKCGSSRKCLGRDSWSPGSGLLGGRRVREWIVWCLMQRSPQSGRLGFAAPPPPLLATLHHPRLPHRDGAGLGSTRHLSCPPGWQSSEQRCGYRGVAQPGRWSVLVHPESNTISSSVTRANRLGPKQALAPVLGSSSSVSWLGGASRFRVRAES
jgi:hypothetical protein